MCRKHLALIFATIFLISVIGCGLKNVLPSKDVPPLEGYSTVVLVPLSVENPSAEYENLPTLLSYSIGTKLDVRYQDRNWFFDQSKAIAPVSAKLKELNISSSEIYQNPQTAAKLAEALQADIVIAGQLYEPKFTNEESGKIEYEMSQMTAMGASRFYAIFQTAILKADLIVIEAKTNEVIWDGRIVGYKKYKTRYRTGAPKKQQRVETMLADVRKDFVENFVNKLYPAKVGAAE